MNPSDPIAGLEIGTTRTVIAIGESLGDGRVRIVAFSAIPSAGVRKSQIIEFNQARFSVESVLKRLADVSSYAIYQATLAVSGPQINTMSTAAQWPVQRGVVQEDDLAEVENRIYDVALSADRQALELSHLSYELDDIKNITSPKGMTGHVLKLHSLCIHGAATHIANAKNAAREARLEILDTVFAGTCAANAVLTPQMKRDGALVIDLGGGSTSYTAWYDGRLRHAGVVGVGGDHVTNDIHFAFSIPQAQAEQLKVTEASAIIGGESGTARIPVHSSMPGAKSASISRRALNTVVNARMRELFTIIRSKMDEYGCLHQFNAGVYLTGGGSALHDVAELATAVFGCPVAVGRLVPEIEGFENESNPAAYATVAGVLLQQTQEEAPSRSVMDWFHNIFKGKRK